MKRYLLTYTKKRQYAFLLGDALCVLAALAAGYAARFYYLHRYSPDAAYFLQQSLLTAPTVLFFQFLSLYLFDLYNLDRIVSPFRHAVVAVLSCLATGLILSGLLFFFPKYIFSRQVLLFYLLALCLLLPAWRLFAIRFFLKRVRLRRLALVGSSRTISDFLKECANMGGCGFKPGPVCLTDAEEAQDRENLGERKFADLEEMLKEADFDILVFDSSHPRFTNEEVRRILQLKHQGKGLQDLSALYENLTGKIPLDYIDGRWLLSQKELLGAANPFYLRAKRAMDLACSLLLLVLASPLFAVLPILIKLDSKGSVFFKQERLGKERIPFVCYKFRTMVQDAEKKTGPVWSKGRDPRITRMGNIMRKTRLDELPQLFNIILGDMSFVGPRPIREHFANKLETQIPFYNLRFSVKPGLTGWAQVQYDYAGSEQGQFEKFQYELFYIRNMSLVMDLFVVFKTVKTVIQRTGS